ncbi:MAG: hypothetical protein U0792_04025 [Gemmataceae bacterium]
MIQKDDADTNMPATSDTTALRGRVLRVHGLASVVEADDGRIFRCAVRRLLKSLATDERSVVTTGDVVWFRPAAVGSGQWTAGSERPRRSSRIYSPTPHSPLPIWRE